MNLSMNIAASSFKIAAPLALPDNEVHVWRADLENIREDESRWLELLSSDEKERAGRFHFPADRQRYAASRAVLRMILAGYLDSPARDVAFTYSKKEKPSLSPAHAASRITFNLSHSGGVSLYAVARQRELGIDIEKLGRNSDLQGIARRFFSTCEQQQLAELSGEEKVQAFFRCWTRKEAYIKATGDGLSVSLTEFDVSLAAGSRNALLATRPDESQARQWELREVPAGPGYAAALCIQGQGCNVKDWSQATL
jgi:4'-phosphopantetheinyl transferase